MTDTSTGSQAGRVAATRARRIAALLLLVTAALFAIGVAAEDDERADEHAEAGLEAEGAEGHAGENAAESGEAADAHGESAEAAESGEAAERNEHAAAEPGGEESSGEDDEGQVLGVDAENPIAVASAVVLSLALAAALWLTGRRGIAVAVAVFALVFAVFDAAELAHQLDESRTGLAVLAACVVAGHLGVAAAAAFAATRRPP